MAESQKRGAVDNRTKHWQTGALSALELTLGILCYLMLLGSCPFCLLCAVPFPRVTMPYDLADCWRAALLLCICAETCGWLNTHKKCHQSKTA
jgi:hypothetical protein